MTPSDWLLVTLDLAGQRALQPVQLQKCLFLLDKKLSAAQKGVDRIYSFTPYDYGPFDSTVYSDAENFSRDGLVEIFTAPGQSFKTYRISADGSGIAKGIASRISPEILEYAKSLVSWAQNLSFNQLVSAVYTEFPEMKANSVFRG